MKRKQKSIDALILDITEYQKRIYRSGSTISKYRHKWMKVKAFMQRSGLSVYNKDVEVAFLHSALGKYEYKNLSIKDKTLVNVVKQLLEFQNTGEILSGRKAKTHREKFPFDGQLGAFIEGYIKIVTAEKKSTESTIYNYNFYLNQFNTYLASKKVTQINKIDINVVNEYLRQLYPNHVAAKYNAIKIIKHFMHDMYEQGKTSLDFSLMIGNVNYRNQSRLPSTFSSEEIKRLLSSVDRASPKGKRDYAILLIAIRLGLRCSDIVNLQFKDINWEKSSIVLLQQKTGKKIEFTLFADVGNAIIDYLKYGRPISKDKHVFLQLLSPYKNMVSHDIGNLLKPYLVRAKINCKNRKHGPNVLRHSLASRMLADGTPLPIISEALGHSDSKSTQFYLRIDCSSLRNCALDIPLVPDSFYKKEGGVYGK